MNVRPDCEWLKTEYVEKHRTLADIGAEFGVTSEAVRMWVKSCGFVYVCPRNRIDIDWLREQVESERRTQREIADELQTSKGTVSRICAENGIKRPPLTLKEKREKRNTYQNKRYRDDPEYRKKKNRITDRWREEHPEEFSAYQREYRSQNRERCRQWQAKWRVEHREQANARQREYRKRQKERT